MECLESFSNINEHYLNRKLNNEDLFELKKYIIPKLNITNYKGVNGKICIIGGNEVYSGAPYFSAITSLKIGNEMCFVLTKLECAQILKSYSPDLIVYPYLNNIDTKFKKCIDYLKNRIHTAVIGMGIGEIDNTTKMCFIYIFEHFIMNKIFLILDADIIEFVLKTKEIYDLIKNYENCIFTPNKNEFKKMIKFFNINENFDIENLKNLDDNKIMFFGHKIISILNGPKILIKGYYDIFISKNFFFISFLKNPCLKRLAGIGDILAGSMGIFFAWGCIKKKNICLEILKKINIESDKYNECIDAICAFLAAYFIKIVCKKTFEEKGRGIISKDIINKIPKCFSMFENNEI